MAINFFKSVLGTLRPEVQVPVGVPLKQLGTPHPACTSIIAQKKAAIKQVEEDAEKTSAISYYFKHYVGMTLPSEF